MKMAHCDRASLQPEERPDAGSFARCVSPAPASARALDTCLAQVAAAPPPEAMITDPLRTLV
jgi:hypothetical protein